LLDLEQATDLPGRAGVAAPQIGVNLRAFSYKVDGFIGHLINPVLVETFGELELSRRRLPFASGYLVKNSKVPKGKSLWNQLSKESK
jgi:peptide deformylase